MSVPTDGRRTIPFVVNIFGMTFWFMNHATFAWFSSIGELKILHSKHAGAEKKGKLSTSGKDDSVTNRQDSHEIGVADEREGDSVSGSAFRVDEQNTLETTTGENCNEIESSVQSGQKSCRRMREYEDEETEVDTALVTCTLQ
jgi:hypothetical protein